MDSVTGLRTNNHEESRPGISDSSIIPHIEDDADAQIIMESKFCWELRTVIVSSLAYVVFFILLLISFYDNCAGWTSLIPLIVYYLIKIAVFVGLMCMENANTRGSETVKDILEALFMTLFYVFL